MKSLRAEATRPPAIILGGDVNALSIAWNLGRAGIATHAINHPSALVRCSRYCTWIDVPRTAASLEQDWAAYLLGTASDHLKGAVLLAASDPAIQLIAEHREALSARFRLDLSDTRAQLCMLDKLCTYEAATQAGVPTPRYWVADDREQLERMRGEFAYPLIVKPLNSHLYKEKFKGATFSRASNFEELLAVFETTRRAGVRTFFVETIPGLDDKLCSYYSYLDEDGNALFDYTKRIIRRFPVGMGQGVYHITDEVPGVKEHSLRLFRHVGLRGVVNAEFKLDERDGQLKLIECNARFTAADCLLTASGLNLSLFVYERLAGRQPEAPRNFRTGLRLWYPLRDFKAYRQLQAQGQLGFAQWVRSVLHPQVFPVFRWFDPLPALADALRRARSAIAKRIRLQ